MSTGQTVGTALAGAAALLRSATRSPHLDAELLLAHALKRPREDLIAHREGTLPGEAARAFASLVRRRAEGIPIPYLTGTKEFYGRRFSLTPAVLIPRPETEAIIPEALTLLDTTEVLHPVVADIGTGSGVLAISIAAEAPRARVVATDRSARALAVARQNARRHRVLGRLTFIESDLLSEIPPESAPFLLVANLPYVPTEELKRAGETPETHGLRFEPPEALDGGPDGLFLIRRFFTQLRRSEPIRALLRHVLLEHSPTQRRRILELAHRAIPAFRPREVSPFVTRWTRETKNGSPAVPRSSEAWYEENERR